MALSYIITIPSGVTARPTNMTLCVGDSITFNCTVNSRAHTWNLGPTLLSELSITSGSFQDVTDDLGFTYRLVESSATFIVSSATGPGLCWAE